MYYPLSASGNTETVAEVLPTTDGTTELKVRGIAVDTIRQLSKDINIRSKIRSKPAESDDLTQFVSDCRRYKTQDPGDPVKQPALRHWRPGTSEVRLHPQTGRLINMASRIKILLQRPTMTCATK